jgi:hypothetical protein
MPQEKPLRGPRLFADVPMTKGGKQMTFKQAVNSDDLSDLMSGKSNSQIFGEQAQLDRERASKYYKANPAARQYAMARATAASKNNAPMKSGQLKTAALQDEMRRGTNKARDQYQIEKDNKRLAPIYQQQDMQEAKLQAEERSAASRAKSPATIQKAMAAGTRKTQAASAKRSTSNGTFKGGSPRSTMSKNLKIK